MSDEYLTSWAYWQFKTFSDLTTVAGTGSEGFYNDDGTLQTYKVKALARSYMPYTQGSLSSIRFDPESSEFDAEFRYESGTQGVDTVAYLNAEFYYPDGLDIEIMVNDLVKIDLESMGYSYTDNLLSFDLGKATEV